MIHSSARLITRVQFANGVWIYGATLMGADRASRAARGLSLIAGMGMLTLLAACGQENRLVVD